MPVDYQRPEVSGAHYFKDTCGGYGAPEVAYYPYHQIFISVAVVSGAFPAIGLHVPPGVTAGLDGDRIEISGLSARGSFRVDGIVLAARHSSLGNSVQRSQPFLWQPDPYVSPLDLGPLHGGGTLSGGYLWYLYTAFPPGDSRRSLQLPANVISGVIRLPSITVNGKRYPPQLIPFKRQTVSGIMPVNC
jgi:hypothetical protein